ncbi:50S ribosomal protein L23 [Candidatus Uhrbacteria bacterium]|jgi:large subunit ribosomal protein L23|nr:50S ribosomal protein L23 [Candidatus Uhrbacteria bacterium]
MGIFNKKTEKNEARPPKVEQVAKKPAAKKVAKKASVTKKTAKKKNDSSLEALAKAHEVLLGPLVTEKTAMLSDKNILVLRVATGANRVAIRNAINALYNVVPTKVNVMNVRGKRKRFGKTMGKRSDWKKAIITLPEGSHIDIFEGV